jgi:tetratricopeptide (TPR) repeat protein
MRTAITLLLVVLGTVTARAEDCKVAGRIDGLLLDKVKVNTIDSARMSIVRATEALAVTDGMPVCNGDLITARPGIVAIVRVGVDPVKDNTVTLYGEAVITVENPGSVFAKLGRVFALLRGEFDVRTNFGTLGARGTQFEVNAADTQVQVMQLEGEVQVADAGVAGTPRVQPLQELTITPATPAAKPRPMPAAACAELTRTHSNVVSSSRPALPFEASGRSDELKEIARDFADARERLLCRKEEAAAAMLAKAWSNYAEPGGVIKLTQSIPPQSSSRDAALYANSTGNAYRQLGYSNEAINWFKRALEIDAGFAFPHNGIGDAHRDLGLAALARNESEGALREFDLAQQAYEKSLDRGLWGKGGGSNRAVPMVNLGDLALLRIVVEPTQGAALLDRARQWFEQALGETDGRHAFARLGLARVDFMRAMLIPDVDVQGPTGWDAIGAAAAYAFKTQLERKPHIDSARDRIRKLLDDFPEFSAASLLWGEIEQVFGSRDNAKKRFRDAVRFDPHNVQAYSRLAQVLTARKDRSEKALFESTFRAAAYPALVPVIRGRVKSVDGARPAAIVQDVRALAPSRKEIVFGTNYDSQWEPITLTNAGQAPVTVGAVTVAGDDASAFTVQAERCANLPFGAGATCQIQVRYDGSGERNQSARLVIGSSSGMDARISLKAVRQRVPGSGRR